MYYILVLEYANDGNLRDYLRENFISLEWKDKIRMALDIACGLKFLHSKEIIHRDLHSKNILVNDGKLLIADFGLSKKLAETSTNSLANKNGMIEYTDPQSYKSIEYKKNKKSDIYGLGVLLWEISSGRPPFPNCCSRETLKFHISINGHREEPIVGTPLEYQQLYKECWDGEPNSRPDIEKVYETLVQLKTPSQYNINVPEKYVSEDNSSDSLYINSDTISTPADRALKKSDEEVPKNTTSKSADKALKESDKEAPKKMTLTISTLGINNQLGVGVEGKIINLLIVGQINCGKSALANILCDTDFFEENERTIRNSKDFQEFYFKWNGEKYIL